MMILLESSLKLQVLKAKQTFVAFLTRTTLFSCAPCLGYKRHSTVILQGKKTILLEVISCSEWVQVRNITSNWRVIRDHGTHRLWAVNSCTTFFYCAVRTCTIGVEFVQGLQHSIIALFCTGPFLLWLKDVWNAVCNQSNVFAVFFSPLPFLVGMVIIASSTLLAQVVNELRVPWVTSNCSSVPISTVIAPQSLLIQDSAAALTCGRGPDLDLRLSFTLYLRHMSWSCWLHAFVSKVRQSCRKFLKWSGPRDSTRGRRLVFLCLQIGLVDRPIINRHLPPLASASCLPSCTAIRLLFFFPFFISYRPGYYWNDGGVIDYLPMDSLFLWFNPLLRLFFAFPSQNWSCLLPA